MFNATEEITNIRLIISFFKAKLAIAIDTGKGGEDEEVEQIEDVTSVIFDNLGSLELLESARMGDQGERYNEKDHVEYFQTLMKVVYCDSLALLS